MSLRILVIMPPSGPSVLLEEYTATIRGFIIGKRVDGCASVDVHLSFSLTHAAGRAVWVDLTGDGRKSILTARAKSPSLLKNGKSVANNGLQKGQLVWLEMPRPHTIDESTGTPLEADGTVFDPFSARHTPWKEQ